MPRFSANLGFLWTELPLLERVARAGAAGFRAVEMHWPFDVPPEAVRDACARHGVALLGINTRVGDLAAGEFGLAALPRREAQFRAAFDEAVAWGRIAGANAIHVVAGLVPEDGYAAARAAFLDNLRWAAPRAAEAGLTILLEPMNPRDRPGYFYDRVEHAAAIISLVGAANLRIMFDVYHVAISQGDVIRRLERHAPLIGHVQIASVPMRREPDEGEIHYPTIFRTLDALGYAGWVGAEYRPRGAVEDGLAWLHAEHG